MDKVTKDKIEKYTQENLGKFLEESISAYLQEKGLLNVMVVNRDTEYRPRRELRAPYRSQEFVREYDGLFVVETASGYVLLNNASQLHLTRKKLDKVISALLSVTHTMIPGWRRQEEYPLRCRCPTAMERWLTSYELPSLRLMVTYFTLEEGLDVIEEVKKQEGLMDLEFVQFDLLQMETCMPIMRRALDNLLCSIY
jgi:hypothetical protein